MNFRITTLISRELWRTAFLFELRTFVLLQMSMSVPMIMEAASISVSTVEVLMHASASQATTCSLMERVVQLLQVHVYIPSVPPHNI